jgi:CopG family nickel-responsive transcriptional regulator
MHRVTVTLDDDLMAELDRMIARRGYQNRSEAIRDLARAGIRQAADETGSSGQCVAALVYVYDHEARELSKRLTRSFHDHHDLSLAAMHVHLDHADHVVAERGVRHGRVVMVPVALEDQHHAHGDEPGHRHLHSHVREAG